MGRKCKFVGFCVLLAGAAAAEDDGTRALKLFELFELPPIQSYVDRDAEVRRASYVDGYDNDMPVVSFIRERGASPKVMVTARIDRGGGESVILQIEAAVPADVWKDVLQASRYFDRILAPLPPAPNATLGLCAHGWSVAVEAADRGLAAYQGPPAHSRSRSQSVCTDSLVEQFAFVLAAAAVKLFPQCAQLDRTDYRNDVELLNACVSFEGDVLAAAAAYNDVRRSHQSAEPCDSAPESSFDWAGEPIAIGKDAACARWRDKFEGDNPVTLRLRRIVGEAPDRVRFEFSAARSLPKAPDEIAAAEMIWTASYGSDFRPREMRVGEFKRRRDR